MFNEKFARLVKQGFLSENELVDLATECAASGKYAEDLLLSRGIPKHEILFCLTEYYGYPFIEYDEDIMVSAKIIRMIDLEAMKAALWMPLYFDQDQAEVIVYHPDESRLDEIKKKLKVSKVSVLVALPSDIIRIIENNLDLNPNFGVSGSRNSLAFVRIFFAERRSVLASYRTSLAKGRTGLAFMRTGISFITISIVLYRVFGTGISNIFEAAVFLAGVVMLADGLRWYLPTRNVGRKMVECASTQPTGGTTVMELSNPGNSPCFIRSGPIGGAAKLRADWCSLSPVMRRRFLASDRTDLSEERTTLACHRTLMAKGRNGLAFTRTGIAFVGLGIVLLKQFGESGWTLFDIGLIAVGVIMALEGFYWYLPGRRSGIKCIQSIEKAEGNKNIWEIFFPPTNKQVGFYNKYDGAPPVRRSFARGIWTTTGLALERTMLADRRNVMARLRTIMARARTGLAFINTGSSLAAVGMGLLTFYGPEGLLWIVFELGLVAAGLLLIADGLYWYIPAEKTRRKFPYCFAAMEIIIPDYGKPASTWQKLTIEDENI